MDTKKLLKELKKEFPTTMPKTIAEQGDLLYQVTAARLELARTAVAYLSELETALENNIIENLPKENASGISGRVANVKIIPFSVPQVDTENNGWDKVWGWIKKQKGLDGFAILGRSLNKKAVEELNEGGKIIPGTKRFTGKKVSCTKVK